MRTEVQWENLPQPSIPSLFTVYITPVSHCSGRKSRDLAHLAEKTRELDISKKSLACLPPE